MGTRKARKDRSPIEGRLGSVSLQDLIQLVSMTRRNATLALKYGAERGFVFFREGQIVHASAGPEEGEDGLLRLLEWTQADFAVEDGVKSLPRVSITVSTEALLLDALRRFDERSARRGSAEPVTAGKEPRRRYPRRRARRARVPWAGAALGLLVALSVGVLTAGDVLFGAPWAGLPDHRNPSPRLAPSSRPAPSLASFAGSPTDEAPAAVEPETGASDSAPSGIVHSLARTPPGTAFPPAREGYLTVVADPWAFIIVDGTLIGETPLQKIPLAAGQHQLTLTHPDVLGAIRAEVDISPDDEVTRRYSFADVGHLLVLAESWANVAIDGRAIGQTPLPRVTVPAGPHVIRFDHPELGTRERTGVVRSGETTRVDADWRTP